MPTKKAPADASKIMIRARVDLQQQTMQSYIRQENQHARRKHEN